MQNSTRSLRAGRHVRAKGCESVWSRTRASSCEKSQKVLLRRKLMTGRVKRQTEVLMSQTVSCRALGAKRRARRKGRRNTQSQKAPYLHAEVHSAHTSVPCRCTPVLLEAKLCRDPEAVRCAACVI